MSEATRAAWAAGRLAQSRCGKAHHGACTEGKVYARAEAEAALVEQGWVFDSETVEWSNAEGVRGRLSWAPDFCNPESAEGRVRTGPRWWLQRPNGQGTIPVLGG